MRTWFPAIVAYLWLAAVSAVMGFATAALVGVSMIAVAILGMWEAGRAKNAEIQRLRKEGE